MKKILPVIGLLMLCSQLFSQTGEKKGWPSVERYAFIRECIKSASVNMSVDTSRFYCYCMLEKVEAKYPKPEDSEKDLTPEKLGSEEWQREIRACLKGYWSGKDREGFLTNCIDAAKTMGEEKARNYCECMLYKVEKKFPDVDKLSITEEDLQKPEWMNMIKECLAF